MARCNGDGAPIVRPEPTAVHVSVVARVQVMPGLLGGALAGMIARRGPGRAFLGMRAARVISVRDMRRGMPAGPVDLHQLLVRRIGVMHVGEQCFGGEEAEAEREDERRQRTQEAGVVVEHSSEI